MKKYAPLIPVVTFGVLLVLPIGLLAWVRPSRQEPAPTDAPAQTDSHVAEQVSQLSQRLSTLESHLEEMRRELAEQRLRNPPQPFGATEQPASPLAAVTFPNNATQFGATEPAPENETPAPTATNANPTAPISSSTASLNTASLNTAAGSWLTWFLTEARARPAVVASDQASSANQLEPTTDATQLAQTTETPTPATPEPVLAATTEPKAEPPAEAVTPQPDKPRSTPVASRTKKPSSKSRTKKPDPAEADMPDEDVVAMHAFGAEPDPAEIAQMVDVRISRPAPGSVVARWEDVIAMTLEPGWPVVLVRSEDKGDSWWVQQTVTRQGNVIGARVNFGNVDTLSAKGFEMVILLLDNSAQAVRFRTAHEFKSIPPGLRRSPVFRYVRG